MNKSDDIYRIVRMIIGHISADCKVTLIDHERCGDILFHFEIRTKDGKVYAHRYCITRYELTYIDNTFIESKVIRIVENLLEKREEHEWYQPKDEHCTKTM